MMMNLMMRRLKEVLMRPRIFVPNLSLSTYHNNSKLDLN